MAGATVSLLPTGTKHAKVCGNGLQREPFRVDLSHGAKPKLAQHGDGVLRLSDLDGTIPQASHGSRAALLLTGTKPGTGHWHQR